MTMRFGSLSEPRSTESNKRAIKSIFLQGWSAAYLCFPPMSFNVESPHAFISWPYGRFIYCNFPGRVHRSKPLGMEPAQQHRLSFPGLLLGAWALAFGPWFVRLADVGPIATGFWRLAIALPFLWLIARYSGQPAHWPRRGLTLAILGAAIFYALDLALWNIGIRLTKLGNATLFGNSGSLVFACWGLWLARRLPVIHALALLLAVAGSVLLMSSSYELSPKNLAGDAFTLVAGLLYGGYLILVDKVRTELPALPLLFLATAFATPILLVLSIATGERIWPHDWTPVVLFALSSQVLGQGLLVFAIGNLSPLVVGLVLLSQPAIAAIIGWFAYGERLSAIDIVGAVAIAAALVLVRVPDRGLRAAA
jgi:drug/metabolite transporter (DMT)-like permease